MRGRIPQTFRIPTATECNSTKLSRSCYAFSCYGVILSGFRCTESGIFLAMCRKISMPFTYTDCPFCLSLLSSAPPQSCILAAYFPRILDPPGRRCSHIVTQCSHNWPAVGGMFDTGAETARNLALVCRGLDADFD